MHKEILINSELNECRAAIVENGKLEEFYVERSDSPRLVGSIYKGKVRSFLPGIGAAFVDIGLPKSGFLQPGDTMDLGADIDDASQEGQALEQPTPIEELLKKDEQILAQVIKEPIGTKGPRITTNISLPGRYLVLVVNSSRIGISKRIESEKERARLKAIVEELIQKDSPQSIRSNRIGFIVRTAGEGKSKKDFFKDAKFLYDLWSGIRKRAARVTAPCLVNEDYDLPLRLVRDSFGEDIARIIVDSKKDYKRLYHFAGSIANHLKRRIELYSGDAPLFEKKNIEKEIAKLYEKRIDLNCGGSIVIEQTEGLVAIDVNTGKFTGERSHEDTAYIVNSEAAREIARQVRLRDLGGIIVVDFIDMELNAHRRQVYNLLKEVLKRDRAKIDASGFSEFGIVEMTRQRMRRSIESISYRSCPYCQGRGNVKSAASVAIYALKEIKRHFKQTGKKELEVYLHPEAASYLLKDDRPSLAALEKIFGGKVFVMSNPDMHIEDVRIKSN